MRETSILVFISLPPPALRWVSRSINATVVNRGMPQTLTKRQLSQLWYSRRAVVVGGSGAVAGGSHFFYAISAEGDAQAEAGNSI